jgi:hypothetical protein
MAGEPANPAADASPTDRIMNEMVCRITGTPGAGMTGLPAQSYAWKVEWSYHVAFELRSFICGEDDKEIRQFKSLHRCGGR